MEGEEEYVIAQPAPSSTVKRFVRKVIQFAKQFMKNESTYPKRIHYGDGYFLTSKEMKSELNLLVSDELLPRGRVHEDNSRMGKILKWTPNGEFMLVVECEELDGKFKWTYYVCAMWP
jgi:hypothetical protein